MIRFQTHNRYAGQRLPVRLTIMLTGTCPKKVALCPDLMTRKCGTITKTPEEEIQRKERSEGGRDQPKVAFYHLLTNQMD